MPRVRSALSSIICLSFLRCTDPLLCVSAGTPCLLPDEEGGPSGDGNVTVSVTPLSALFQLRFGVQLQLLFGSCYFWRLDNVTAEKWGRIKLFRDTKRADPTATDGRKYRCISAEVFRCRFLLFVMGKIHSLACCVGILGTEKGVFSMRYIL